MADKLKPAPAFLDGLTTLTGEPLIAALNALDEELPKGAYKPVKMGGRTFTDISPAYTTEEISNRFGPLGIGWGYTIEDEYPKQHERAVKDREGNPTGVVVPFLGVTLRVRLWYVYLADGEMKRVNWQTYGGNANNSSGPDEHFSWQGALTNAIGKGWSLQGFQRTIYKGEDFTLTDSKPRGEDGQDWKDNGSPVGSDAPIVRAIYGKKKALSMDDATMTGLLTKYYSKEHPGDLSMKDAKDFADRLEATIKAKKAQDDAPAEDLSQEQEWPGEER